MSAKEHKLPPNPSRLIEGLRDTGYDFNTALADVVDNSVDAIATVIDIRIQMDSDGDIVVTVADNGCGMDEKGLLDGMTYGAVGHIDSGRLGKFGLGLKTASTAFCRKLSVITRDSIDTPCLKATWDLDYVANVANDWVILLDKPNDFEEDLLNKAASGSSGTLVVWDNVDRVLKAYADSTGAYARKALQKVVDAFSMHASMVYQRFLDPNDDRAKTIEIKLNGEKLEAWSPFCEDEDGTDLVAQDTRTVVLNDGEKTKFTIKAFILPRKEQFSSEAEQKKARLSNKMQGFYIYRENRLIHPADWLGMFSKEPHMSLLRVEFSFDHDMDDAFQVDIKKSKILLNEALYEWIRSKFITGPRNAAAERYRTGQKKKVSDGSKGAHSDSNSNIRSKEEDLRMADITVNDREKNKVDITNAKGQVRLKLAIDDSGDDKEVSILTVDSIDDGLLWEPALLHQHHGVRINVGHPYYHKVYVPNYASGVTMQGLDSLLWALSEAELGTVNESTKNHFQELRFEVSRLLRRLVEDLPDPELGD